ncbi:MAG: PucR family transcriptional regulator ligand-binding domain-containing protein [Lachnospiraceae bacterium]|nr:PucR family transcriptional regulator ligand-binding domain-containing protein [Lachnospiraceae bacterium]
MGYTIEDMLLFSQNRYKMELIAGKNGWSNSITWLFMLEDLNVIRHFAGKELAVTTALGFESVEKLYALVEKLLKHHASGLIINTGGYLDEVPAEIIELCDKNDFPLLTVPWEIILAEMIKDITTRVFYQGMADERIEDAFIRAIEEPDNKDAYRLELLPYFDIEGTFQIALLTTEDLESMDTVERKRLGYRMQLYLENITHNGCFFYYDSNFVLVMNDVSYKDMTEIIEGMVKRAKLRMPNAPLYVGVGSCLLNISNLYLCYERAKSAVTMAYHKKRDLVYYEDMGIFRMLFAVKDKALLGEMEMECLKPIIEYDKKHNSNYLKTFENYLRYNGSIQAVSEVMYTHRNTVIYRISNIKKLLGSNLESPEERLPYQLAFYIRNMN